MERTWVGDTTKKIGERVTVAGWVHARRDHGKLIFVDLRDRSGLLQVVFRPGLASGDDSQEVRSEWVVIIGGEIKARPEPMTNPNIVTGAVELIAEKLEVVARAETPPFELSDETAMKNVDEELRLKYRYLDLRRPAMFSYLKIRHEVVRFIREFLSTRGFIEIETPILAKSTPEGARDYLVPSRKQHGSFYALPQSPQQYKQLLMVAGIERYFQIARCFRDEDTRADRHQEFTQLDLEMSFVTQEDILHLVEELYTQMVGALFPEKRIRKTPWPKLSYDAVMREHGTDRPDLRENKDDPNELAFAWVLDFPLFEPGMENESYAPSHHMFTAPRPEDVGKLDSDPASVKALQHDLVLNGYEIGGGSIRIHDPELQKKIFDLIGFSKEEKAHFQHMLTAFTYGVPPHGGIAPGIDRTLMGILGQSSIRELIAFPKTGDGRDPMMQTPAPVTEPQLKELGITLSE